MAVQVRFTRDIPNRPARFAWYPWLPWEEICVITGRKGVNKGTMLVDLAMRLSWGHEMPNRPQKLGRMIRSLFLLGEDSDSEFKRRVDAAGGNDSDILHVGRSEGGRLPRLPRDWPDIEAALVGHNVRFLVIDPLTSFCHIGSDAAIDAALEPVSAWCRANNAACAVTRHLLEKATGRTVSGRAAGSHRLAALARAGLFLGPHPEDPGERRVIIQQPSNCPPTLPLAFRLEPVPEYRSIRIRWEGVYICTEEEVLCARQEGKLHLACKLLLAARQAGPVYTSQARELAKQHGVSWRTMEEAKKALRMKGRPVGKPGPGAEYVWV
jgi:hypothetical protein